MYLKKEQLQDLSGARQKAKIVRWLDKLEIKHIPDVDGWPIADEAAIRAKLGETTKREPRINFA